MTYQVKEIFYTLQGEGANAGRPAVFCRFAGCNLWSGREEDRAQALKVVVPQPGLALDELAALPFERFYLQPMDGPALAQNTEWAIAHCLRDPRWRLSVQTHKFLGIR